MRSRRSAREAVLQALYQCDTLGDYSRGVVDLYFDIFHGIRESEVAPAIEENYRFARRIIEGVALHLEEIDEKIGSVSIHWSVVRMPRVDRNILRMALFEIEYCSDIPINVTLNEAIEVAKRFGSDDSPMFINGVLDKAAAGAAKRNGPESLKKAAG